MRQTSLTVHKISDIASIRDRRGFIVKACENRSVLHLGCADWPLTAESLQDGTLLHLSLSKVSNRTFGMDSSEEGLSVLRAHGFRDLIQWDVENLDHLRMEGPVEVIVAGEILEHLSNPGLCLQGISQFMRHSKSKLIISVPNAFSIRHFASLMFRKTELVNPEHTAYYSVTTLSELLRRYDLQVREIYTYTEVSNKSSPLNRFAKRALNAILHRVFPQISEGIIAVVENGNGNDLRKRSLASN
jgi:2-polyprenyl-3-methyl-5-hydroxy-6-metoxy-1,4-benzoquinol methylase